MKKEKLDKSFVKEVLDKYCEDMMMLAVNRKYIAKIYEELGFVKEDD